MNAHASQPDEFGRSNQPAPLLDADETLAGDTPASGRRRDGPARDGEPITGTDGCGAESAGAASSPNTLPALRHQNIVTHWQAADAGGAELMATFGGPATCPPPRRITSRPSFVRPEEPRSEAPTAADIAQSSLKRLRATVVLILLVLTIFLAEPMLRLLARAFVQLARAEAPVTLVAKAAPAQRPGEPAPAAG